MVLRMRVARLRGSVGPAAEELAREPHSRADRLGLGTILWPVFLCTERTQPIAGVSDLE